MPCQPLGHSVPGHPLQHWRHGIDPGRVLCNSPGRGGGQRPAEAGEGRLAPPPCRAGRREAGAAMPGLEGGGAELARPCPSPCPCPVPPQAGSGAAPLGSCWLPGECRARCGDAVPSYGPAGSHLPRRRGAPSPGRVRDMAAGGRLGGTRAAVAGLRRVRGGSEGGPRGAEGAVEGPRGAVG